MIYRIVAALREDNNQGWIWASGLDLKRRSVARIENTAKRKAVYCEVRDIDEAYRNYYRECFHDTPIDKGTPAAALSHWYRQKLGILSAGEDHALTISVENNLLGFVRSVLDHPQVLVKFCYVVCFAALALGAALWFQMQKENQPSRKPAVNKAAGLFRP